MLIKMSHTGGGGAPLLKEKPPYSRWLPKRWCIAYRRKHGRDESHISCFILGCLWTSDHKLFLLPLFPLEIKMETLVKHAAIFRLKPCGRPKFHVVCPTRNHNYQAGSHLRDFNLHNLHLLFILNTQNAVTQKTPPSYMQSWPGAKNHQGLLKCHLTPFPILLVSQMPSALRSFSLKPNNTQKNLFRKTTVV